MKRPDQDKILRELLTGDEVSDFRKASLAGGLASLRRRRRVRSVVRFGAVMALALLATVAIVHREKHKQSVQQMAFVNPMPTSSIRSAASPAPAAEGGVKVISDEELFALFPGRSMALIGTPGQQQLVFLDGGAARAKVR
jgi:hypothetical protein